MYINDKFIVNIHNLVLCPISKMMVNKLMYSKLNKYDKSDLCKHRHDLIFDKHTELICICEATDFELYGCNDDKVIIYHIVHDSISNQYGIIHNINFYTNQNILKIDMKHRRLMNIDKILDTCI